MGITTITILSVHAIMFSMKTSFAIDDFHSWDIVVGIAHFSCLLHGKVKREVRRARQTSKAVTKNYKVKGGVAVPELSFSIRYGS